MKNAPLIKKYHHYCTSIVVSSFAVMNPVPKTTQAIQLANFGNHNPTSGFQLPSEQAKAWICHPHTEQQVSGGAGRCTPVRGWQSPCWLQVQGTQLTKGPPSGISLLNPAAQDWQNCPVYPMGHVHSSTQPARVPGPGRADVSWTLLRDNLPVRGKSSVGIGCCIPCCALKCSRQAQETPKHLLESLGLFTARRQPLLQNNSYNPSCP